MFAIKGLVELVLEVRDLERAAAFYHELLGLPVERWDARVVVIEGDTFRLQLRLYGTPGHRGAGPCHFAFGIEPEEIDPLAANLSQKGWLARGPVDFGEQGRSVFCFDPDGNELEFSDHFQQLIRLRNGST